MKEGFQALDRTLPFSGVEVIDTEVLDCFDYEYPGRDIEIETKTEEFTSVCPFSGLPDFAALTITYTPDKSCLELRSLKYYLMSYRNVGIWYEHLVNRMLDDLVQACKPKSMSIRIEVNSRGGLSSNVEASYRGCEKEDQI